MEIKVTTSAVSRIKELMAINNKIALRVSVDGGGCSGFMYNYELVTSINDDDYVNQIDDIKIIIDPISSSFLDGCTLEFVRELGNNYFQIINPKATAKCGCGSSFAI